MLTVLWISALWGDAVEHLQNAVVIQLSSEQCKHFFGQHDVCAGGQQQFIMV